jgi:hypothetical protein
MVGLGERIRAGAEIIYCEVGHDSYRDSQSIVLYLRLRGAGLN